MIKSVLIARNKYLKGYNYNSDDDELHNFIDNIQDELISINTDDDSNTNDNDNNEQKIDNNNKAPPPLPKYVLDNINNNRGLLMPSHCNMYICPIDVSDYWNKKVTFWDDVYGCSMKCLKNEAVELFLNGEVQYDLKLNKNNFISEPQIFGSIDMYKLKEYELKKYEYKFEFKVNKDSLLSGFVGYFDVTFNPLNALNDEQIKINKNISSIILTTSPATELYYIILFIYYYYISLLYL